MRIAEIFYSLQGEGKLLGIPSVFVRVSGCNLRCTWCDTPYASWYPEGEDQTLDQIIHQILKLNAASSHIVLTGGEPMMFKETPDLIHQLKSRGMHITVETAGTLWPDGFHPNSIDLLSVSPKLANSTPTDREQGRFAKLHEDHRLSHKILHLIATGANGTILDRQWKFVVASPADLPEIETLIATLNQSLPKENQITPPNILLMPEGTDAATLSQRSLWLADLCKQKGYRLSPRLHVHLYGHTRAT